MSVSLTPQDEQTLKRLLRRGPWGNESEIIRYGLHLVEKEIESSQWPELIPDEVMARIYREESQEERTIENTLTRASQRIKPEYRQN